MKIKVLDKGYVEMVDLLGGDMAAVRSARISYMSKSDPRRDEKLIELLAKLGHESPFEHIVFTFYIKAPIFVARQWMRHRIASINERSGRFTEFEEEFYVPDPERSDNNTDMMREAMEGSFRVYKELISKGVKKEVARMVLPLSLYTEWYWTVNARSLMNFLNQRADSHAQYEIQRYAIAVAECFKNACPLTYNAFLKHIYKGNLLEA
ncbi:FAD-dependent thymidylate synthase [Athalassotoga saccharophila]|uniref:FAD-dependent thymidylate synthase n=1 Tax=Athalassotoga saccharophila TaxID=1441386 RepID=UPI00137A3288|nr:FAD-dependent thymidylate synthase [Athalassotoga saccharophila]BBJ27767.1 flavin-dependent thymidylate synthase [Athalassotoga saccharophila]